jgi:hypothetical protein
LLCKTKREKKELKSIDDERNEEKHGVWSIEEKRREVSYVETMEAKIARTKGFDRWIILCLLSELVSQHLKIFDDF